MPRIRHLGVLAALVFACAVSAQEYPTKPVRILVPYPPGGASDVTARVLADKLSKRWGKPVFVENKAGANGVIGTETIAHAEPDGHTMGLVASSHVTNHALMKSVPYALADMTPVTITAQVQLGLVVHPSVPASTVRELVAYAKANPDKLAVATSGRGSNPQLWALAFDLGTTTVVATLLDIATGGLEAGLTRLQRGPRVVGGRLGGFLNLVCGEFVFMRLRGSLLQLGDRSGALGDVGLQPSPLGQRRDGRSERGIGGGGDHLGLLELLGQRGDLLGRGSGNGQALDRLRPLAREPLAFGGEGGVRPDGVVDLGDRSRAPCHLVVGVSHAFGRGGPLAGRPSSGGEVAKVLGVDPVDQQRLGAGHLHRFTGGHIERPG